MRGRPRRHGRDARDEAQDGSQVEVRPDHRAGRDRRERDHEQGDPLAPAAERREPARREQDADGERERQHRERVPVGLGVEGDQARHRDQRRCERWVLEADLAIGQDAVEEHVGVRAVERDVVDELVLPRVHEEREAPGRGQQHDRAGANPDHALTGSVRCLCAANSAASTNGVNHTTYR